MQAVEGYRAAILHFFDDPSKGEGAWQSASQAEDALASLPDDVIVKEYPNCVIVPGFIDTHVHYPQTDMIASYGE